ncbi:hypothetical protein [Aliiglaciecola sp. LCG003]|uniref:hypothetical protein n=1 Tax=Aliiglaciecola sp. LCG003 TaxID=3053655 RepID=UPI00257451C6|nr:hypothetical protein [Aliiglaciecola sp. LCG003]WJG09167.1 hypothetical protein QR722_17845 [Aliiglaciecola sp. LCG003]
MKIKDITAIAKERGISRTKMSKTRLIKAIQLNEGNFDCFATAQSGICDQLDCIWRSDCFDSAKGKVH